MAQVRRRVRRNRRKIKKNAGSIKKLMKLIKVQRPELKIAKYHATALQLNDILSYNIMYHQFSQGAGESQFVGNQFRLKGISVMYDCSNDGITSGTGGFTQGVSNVLISIIATKTYRTVTNLLASEMEDTDLAPNNAFKFAYDPDKVKVLAQRKIVLNGQSNGSTGPGAVNGNPAVKSGRIYIRMNKLFTFRDFKNNFEAKDWNYYVVFQSNTYGFPGLLQATATDFNIRTYYTDN